jgi:hypothetical protein
MGNQERVFLNVPVVLIQSKYSPDGLSHIEIAALFKTWSLHSIAIVLKTVVSPYKDSKMA